LGDFFYELRGADDARPVVSLLYYWGSNLLDDHKRVV